MTTIYLIRHAEAEGNYYRRIQGHHDGKITSKGYVQIAALAERFKDVHIDALYSSDLSRTMTTASAITKYNNLPLNTDPRLREVNLGVWEDRLWGNAAYDMADQLFYFNTDPDRFYIEGSETFTALKRRIKGVLSELAAKHDGETIATFCHGMAIRSLISDILNLPSVRVNEVLHGDNTCVAKLLVENGNFEIEYYNDNSHLDENTSTFAGQKWWKEDLSVDVANLRIIPMCLDEDAELYKNCYADAWQESHGSLQGFNAESYLKTAKKTSDKSQEYLGKAFIKGTSFAGILELDPNRLAEKNAGWISFLYLIPELRGQGYAPQLLGEAISIFRRLGRNSLRLNVAVTNERAIRFYEKHSFKRIGIEMGMASDLLLMEMPL